MQLYSEKNKSTVVTMQIQTPEGYKFLSNRAVVVATIHKAMWRVCHWTQRLPNADVEKYQCAGAWYRHENPLHCSLCDISFTNTFVYVCICSDVVYLVAPAQRAQLTACQLVSQCCPLLPCYPPHCSCNAITFACVHLYDWNWDCCGLVVTKCGDSADQ